MLSFCRLASGYLFARLLFALLILISISPVVYGQAQPTGTLTSPSSCYLPGSESTTRCTANLNITKQNTPIACVWLTNPATLVSCQGQASWTVSWRYATTTPTVIELRAYSDWPASTEAARLAGALLAQTTVVAKVSTGTLTTDSPCSLPGPEAPTRCTVNFSATKQNVPVACIWGTNPTALISCQGLASWNSYSRWITTTPQTVELRGHNSYPQATEAGRATGILLAQKSVVASSASSSSSSSVPSSSSSSSRSSVLSSSSVISSSSSSSIPTSSSSAQGSGSVPTPPAPVLATAPAPSSTIDQARALAGEFNVTSGGQATYTVPILAAPGSGGMAPNVSVSYNSGAGNGPMGLGWSLNAGGSISRCRQTEGQDKNAAPITWSTQDRFCLNGERLLVVTGQYGVPGSTYKTEIDNFARITAVGGSSGHPDHFKVEYKDGRINYYGKNDYDQNVVHHKLAADKILSWMLTVSEDSAGNKIRYYYDAPSMGALPLISFIRYAYDAAGTSHAAEMSFYWETRSDQTQGFIGGYAYSQKHILDTIYSKNTNQILRSYRFAYNEGSVISQHDITSRLSHIYECTDVTCIQPTEFEWTYPDTSGFILSASPQLTTDSPLQTHAFGDINGDGLQDIAWIQTGDGNVYYALASINAQGVVSYAQQAYEANQAVKTSWYLYGASPSISFMDYNGDGRQDLVVKREPAGWAENPAGTRIYLSKPQADGSWKLSGTPVAFLPISVVDHESLFIDLNGDGLQDVIGLESLRVHYLQAGGNGFGAEQPVNVIRPQNTNTSCYTNTTDPIVRLMKETGDFNGDGRIDFIAIVKVCSQGYSFQIYTSHLASNGGVELRYFDSLSVASGSWNNFYDSEKMDFYVDFRVVDINNDGISDIIHSLGELYDVNGAARLSSAFNNRYQLSDGIKLQPRVITNFSFGNKKISSIVDYNGDGHPDIVTAPEEPTNQLGQTIVRFWNPSINQFSSSTISIAMPFAPALDSVTYRDINGDGAPDYVFLGAYAGPKARQIHILSNKNNYKTSNRIQKITTGLGHSIEIQYERLSKTRNYARIKGTSNTTSESICQTTDVGNVCWARQIALASSAAFYNHINNPFADLASNQQTLNTPVLSAVFEGMGAMQLVTSVSQSAPAANATNPGQVSNAAVNRTSYYYEQLRVQAAGRGSLGFKKFTRIDRQSGLRHVSEYRQDWPFIGHPIKTETFHSSGHLLSRKENTWGLAGCYSGLNQISNCTNSLGTTARAQGTKSLGAVQPFLAKSKATNNHLNTNGGGGLANIVETERSVDNKGNMTFERVSTGLGGAALHVVETTDGYLYPQNTYSTNMGRLFDKTVVTSQYGALGGSSITRQSSYGYYQSGSAIGLLEFEIVEPNNSLFEVRTNHYYNNLGLRVESRTSADGQVRRKEIEYDTRGRYVDKTYEYFTNGTNPDTGLRRLTSHVISRDKYGTPTETRHYVSSTNFVTSKAATTPFGTTYFTADSSGAFTHIDAGVGAGPGSICPSTNKIWQRTSVGGGSASFKCIDVAGRTIREAVQGFAAGTWSAIDYEYNRSDQLIHKSEPRFLSETARWTSNLNMDALGRPAKILGPVREQDGIRPSTDIQYEDALTYLTNPKGQTRVEEKNLLGQVASVKDHINGYTYFTYDARGNTKTMRDPQGNTTTMHYDLRDRKTSMIDPDKGSWSYEYNRFNEIICQKDAKNQAIFHKYDIRGRLVTRTDRKGTSNNCTSGTVEKTTNWLYDTATNGLGKLARVYSVVNSVTDYDQTYTFDSLGRDSIVTTKLQGHNNVIDTSYEKTTYDQFGRVFQIFDAARTTNTFTQNGIQHIYSTTGHLREIKDAVIYGNQQKSYYVIGGMDARGNVIAATYGNGVTKSASYYKDSGLARILSTYSAAPSVALQYNSLAWDQVGNLQSRRETGGGTWIELYLRSRNIQESFQYDNLNRLESWTTAGDFNAAESITYDAIDNIRTKTGIGSYLYGNQCTHVSNAGPHAVCRAGTTNYTYDKNGNLTSDGSGRSLQYTVHDLPSSITKGTHTARFSYGPNGGRYKREDQSSSSVTTTLYLGNVEKIFYPNNTREWKRTIAGAAIVTQTLTSQNVVQTTTDNYLHYDHLGSVSMITDASGRVAKDFYYDPWGASRKPNSNRIQWETEQPFIKSLRPITGRGYTGHEHLDEVGFIHMNGRIYDAKLARFVQADPIIQDPLRVQSLNRYSYVWNNPLNATDPSGFTSLRLRDEDDGNDSGYTLGKTPDMELDGRITPDFDGFMEREELRAMLNATFENARSINSILSSMGVVTIEEGSLSSQTTQTKDGKNSAAAKETELSRQPEIILHLNANLADEKFNAAILKAMADVSSEQRTRKSLPHYGSEMRIGAGVYSEPKGEFSVKHVGPYAAEGRRVGNDFGGASRLLMTDATIIVIQVRTRESISNGYLTTQGVVEYYKDLSMQLDKPIIIKSPGDFRGAILYHHDVGKYVELSIKNGVLIIK